MEELTSNVFDCALVFEGGGYRASYTCAFANVLLERGIYFDYVCGLSAGASNSVNYLSRDRKRVREAFMTGGAAKGLVGLPSLLRGRGYFDADSLYEGALRDGTLAFDWETFSANPARLRIQAFERDTGKTVRFGREDMTDPMRMIDLVRVSSTLPGMMKPIEVDGRVLLDGGLGTGAGIPVCMAEDDGFDRFVFVATRPRGYRKKKPGARDAQMFKAMAKDHPLPAQRPAHALGALQRRDRARGGARGGGARPHHLPGRDARGERHGQPAQARRGLRRGPRPVPARDAARARVPLRLANAGPQPDDPDAGTGYITLG